MNVLDKVPLGKYSTMRLGGVAKHLAEVQSSDDLSELAAWAKGQNLPVIMIGGGSNIIWRDEGFPGLVLVNKITGYDLTDDGLMIVGTGENWDSVVERTVNSGKSGLEYLSLIPGTVGGAPVQNIGAYGHELAETLVSLEAYDTKTDEFVTIPAKDCGFGYRTSRFKTGQDKGRYLITSLKMQLSTPKIGKEYYHTLKSYFDDNNITNPSLSEIRGAVIAVRTSRLPDPNKVANTGSFFANPIVSKEKYQEIIKNHPELAQWPTQCFWDLGDDKYKVAAGALLEYLGYKDFHDPATGMATWKDQALVLVNENAKTTGDLLDFKNQIVNKVQQSFNITLEQEPELLP